MWIVIGLVSAGCLGLVVGVALMAVLVTIVECEERRREIHE